MQFIRPVKFILSVVLCCSCFLLSGCNKPAQTEQFNDLSFDGLSKEKPIKIDKERQTMTILAVVNGEFFTKGTRHGIVSFDGSNARKAIFMGLVPTKDFYDGLIQIKANPGNNMNASNAAETHVTGDTLSMSVNWQGAERAYDVNEVVLDNNKKNIELHFGGNLKAAEEKKTGCLVCLDSCPVGIVSNNAYTYGAVEKRNEVSFLGNSKILPPDNTLVAITFSLKK